MFSSADQRSFLSFVRNFVSDQTLDNIHSVDTGFAMDATLGLLCATNDTAIAAFGIGGFANQSVVAVCGYTSTTTQGSEDFGILLRFVTMGGTDDTYYWIRVDAQLAKITKYVNNTPTTMTQVAFTLPQDTDVTITCSVVGDVLTANFAAGALNVDRSVEDSAISGAGLVGFRTSSSTGYIKSIAVQELA